MLIHFISANFRLPTFSTYVYKYLKDFSWKRMNSSYGISFKLDMPFFLNQLFDAVQTGVSLIFLSIHSSSRYNELTTIVVK